MAAVNHRHVAAALGCVALGALAADARNVQLTTRATVTLTPMLASLRAIAVQPANAAPLWVVTTLIALLALTLLLAVLLLSRRIAQVHATQRSSAASAADAELNRRRAQSREQLTGVLEIEGMAAQLIADAMRQAVELQPLLLLADAEPAPYFSVSDMRGVRYFFTTDPALFKRLRIVRRADSTRNVSALSTSARADMLAAWEALTVLKGFTHIAMPRGADWFVIASNPVRKPASLLLKLRTWRNKRRIDAQSAEPTPADLEADVYATLLALPAPRPSTESAGAAAIGGAA